MNNKDNMLISPELDNAVINYAAEASRRRQVRVKRFIVMRIAAMLVVTLGITFAVGRGGAVEEHSDDILTAFSDLPGEMMPNETEAIANDLDELTMELLETEAEMDEMMIALEGGLL